MDFTKRGGWNKCGGWKIFMKSINVEGGFFLWRVEFFKIGKRGPYVYQSDESRVEPEFEPFCLLML